MAGLRGNRAPLETTQLQCMLVPYNVPSDGVMLSTSEGNDAFTVVKNATGDYTLTMRSPFQRVPCVPAPSPEVANLQVQVVSKTASAVNFKFTNNSGTAVDTAFSGVLFGSYDIVLRG